MCHVLLVVADHDHTFEDSIRWAPARLSNALPAFPKMARRIPWSFGMVSMSSMGTCKHGMSLMFLATAARQSNCKLGPDKKKLPHFKPTIPRGCRVSGFKSEVIFRPVLREECLLANQFAQQNIFSGFTLQERQ